MLPIFTCTMLRLHGKRPVSVCHLSVSLSHKVGVLLKQMNESSKSSCFGMGVCFDLSCTVRKSVISKNKSTAPCIKLWINKKSLPPFDRRNVLST